MSIPHLIFISVFVISISVVVLVKRRVDFLFVYVCVLALYTIPLCFGIIYDPYRMEMIKGVEEQVYLIMAIPFLMSIPFLLLRNDFYSIKTFSFFENKIQVLVILFLIFIGAIKMFPILLSATNKVELLEKSSGISLVYLVFVEVFPVVGVMLAYKYKNYKLMMLFFIFVAFITMSGIRRPLAMVIIGIFILSNNKKIRLFAYYKYIFLGLLGLFFVILSKQLYGYVLNYGVIDGIAIWLEQFEYDFIFKGSEFMGTSAILQSVVINNFKFDIFDWLSSLLAIQPIPLSTFGLSSSIFNEQFQTELFPNITYGMAYNPWAEAYSVLGWFGVLLYSFMIPGVLYLLWYGYSKVSSRYSIIFFMIGILLAFWIQRNSAGSILAYIRNIFYPLLFVVGLSYIFYVILEPFIHKRWMK